MPTNGQQGVIPVTDLTASDFSDFFQDLWDNQPFAWQMDLASRVLENADDSGAWPEAIALPTASGKTACMDIAIFALAAQASRLGSGQPITAPRRIFFVVDRRVIVDQAYERAKTVAQKLSKPKAGGIVSVVVDRLKQIARGETTGFERERPLTAHVLRGGMYRSESWARDPLQPMVVASTVDQVGSRLLFRPYGPSSRTAPIYAGLVANDSLILLDEAHCAQPFMQTLHAVRKYREWAHESLGRKFYPVIMSATPPRSVSDVFTDHSEEKNDQDHPLGKRQLASKPAILKRVAKAKGAQAIAELSKGLAKEALDMARGGFDQTPGETQLELGMDERVDNPAIVVFVNRVATARATYDLLNDCADVDAVLLTGRMRPLDKDLVVSKDLKMLESACSESRSLDKPNIVVATQTLEVGADLDFDGIVTECASLDALRQRFGRLNRTGRRIDARGVILIRDDQTRIGRNAPPDPVYGEALKKTWDWMNDIKNGSDEVDFGIAQLDKLLADADLKELNAPSRDAPVMLPAHVDCWGQTAPMPQPSPDVSLFLRGPQEGAPDVNVCWRADLDLSDDGIDDSLESLTLCPPSSPEMLPVPIRAFRRWMVGDERDEDAGDVEGIESDDGDDLSPNSDHHRRILRWKGVRETDKNHVSANASDFHPGDVVVVPVNYPADPERIGSFKLGLDIGDQAHLKARAKPVLRISQQLVGEWPPEFGAAKELATALLDGVGQKYNEDADEALGSLRELLARIPEDLHEPWEWLSDAASELKRSTASLRRSCHVIGDDKLVIVGSRRMDEYVADAETFSDEDDSASSGTSNKNDSPVKLCSHLKGVETFAKRYAAGCGLSSTLADTVAHAGLLHDLGKADPRFQTWLRGGNPWAFDGQDYWAKSPNVVPGSSSNIRHELYSVRLSESSDGLLPDDSDLRDLVLHLVASHHGHCRPFAPVTPNEECEHSRFELRGYSMSWQGPTNLECLDSGVADRYWRLVRRYGWWGLAWLESIVRLADWRRSEWEETHD